MLGILVLALYLPTDDSFDVAPHAVIEKLIADIYAIRHATTPDYRSIEPQSLALL